MNEQECAYFDRLSTFLSVAAKSGLVDTRYCLAAMARLLGLDPACVISFHDTHELGMATSTTLSSLNNGLKG